MLATLQLAIERTRGFLVLLKIVDAHFVGSTLSSNFITRFRSDFFRLPCLVLKLTDLLSSILFVSLHFLFSPRRLMRIMIVSFLPLCLYLLLSSPFLQLLSFNSPSSHQSSSPRPPSPSPPSSSSLSPALFSSRTASSPAPSPSATTPTPTSTSL